MANEQQGKIDAWWNEFGKRTSDIAALFKRKAEWDLAEWMHEHLGAIHPHLMWEYGQAVNGPGYRLVITSESRRDLRPLVKRILETAPPIDGWEFYPYRMAEEYDMAVQTVEARTGDDISKTFVTAEINELNKINLVFRSAAYTSEDRQAFNDAFVATESLLGEETLDRWIGAIKVETLGLEADAADCHIRQLKDKVDSLMRDIHDSLPDQPYCRLNVDEDEQEWSLYELEPKALDEYPGQTDMFVGRTVIPKMWVNAHCGDSFDSSRFSKCGETFCYAKIEGTEGVDEQKFADKSEIEDALDAALRPDGIGCVVGGGTGLVYSYVDLALVDVRRGSEIIKRVLREGDIPKRTWIMFFDTDLQTEWTGIWEDTPPPPMWPVDE